MTETGCPLRAALPRDDRMKEQKKAGDTSGDHTDS